MKRTLNLLKLLNKKSHFLFGPRAVGKSYLIQQDLSDRATTINLLDSDQYLRLSEKPSLVREIIASGSGKIVVIDEIQRIPELLNEVHLLMERDKNIKFLLTGSSARKLKRTDVNMLGGRARHAELFPLSVKELKENKNFDVNRILQYGGLPSVYLSEEPYEDLRDYLDTYLNEEVQREANVRNLPAFSRFLKVAGISNGKIVNYSKWGSDCQIHPNTVREYFQILVDTLLAFVVEPWQKTKKRKPVQTSKYYLFDTGVTNAITETKNIPRYSDIYGSSFEQLIALELRAYKSYCRIEDTISFWRSYNKDEVDFIIGDHTAIEVKSKDNISSRDHKNLLLLKEEKILKNFILVSNDPLHTKRENGIENLPFEQFIKKLWDGEIF